MTRVQGHSTSLHPYHCCRLAGAAADPCCAGEDEAAIECTVSACEDESCGPPLSDSCKGCITISMLENGRGIGQDQGHQAWLALGQLCPLKDQAAQHEILWCFGSASKSHCAACATECTCNIHREFRGHPPPPPPPPIRVYSGLNGYMKQFISLFFSVHMCPGNCHRPCNLRCGPF